MNFDGLPVIGHKYPPLMYLLGVKLKEMPYLEIRVDRIWRGIFAPIFIVGPDIIWDIQIMH